MKTLKAADIHVVHPGSGYHDGDDNDDFWNWDDTGDVADGWNQPDS